MWIRSKNLIIKVLHRLPRHLLVVFLHINPPYLWKLWTFLLLYGHLKVSRCPFLHSLDVLVKMFTNSLAVLNLQILGRTDHVHCFQKQLRESCWLVWFWVDKRPVCCFFFYKKSLDTWTRFCVDISVFVVGAQRGTC